MGLFMLVRRRESGDTDYLKRVEDPNIPVWTGDRRQASRMGLAAAHMTADLVGGYRDHLCPDGIKGIGLIEIAS